MEKREAWIGGYIRRDAQGRATYVIRKRIDGRRYEVSTRCRTLRAAVKELERFESAPVDYVPGGPVGPSPVYLTSDLVALFADWSETEKKNTPKHVDEQIKLLAWWSEQIAGIDLRGASISKIQGALIGAPGRQKRIAVIKVLFTWLVATGKIKPSEDPTYRVLKVPQSVPEQRKRVKAITQDAYTRTRTLLVGKISDRWIDALDVLAGTGWHVTELERFSSGGDILPYIGGDADVAGVLLCPLTKGGGELRTAVSTHVLEAAKRIQAGPAFRGDSLRTALDRARAKHGIERPMPGAFRHSVATHAINSGAQMGAAADFLGHQSPETTRRFYATHATPKKIPTLK